MATETSPRFTVSLRGYDKDEVDRYLGSLSERASQADDQLYELQEQNRYLEEEHAALTARVEELEGVLRSETPHTAGALGQRITLILTEAEEGASDTLNEAKAQAEYLLAEAREEAETLRRQASAAAAQAAETLISAEREAAELSERLRAEAEATAAVIQREAEQRALRRQEQIEQWAQEAITSTHAEQTRLADEFAVLRRRHDSEVRTLLGDRDDAVAALRSLQTSLARAIERVPTNGPTIDLAEPEADTPQSPIQTGSDAGDDTAAARSGATRATGTGTGTGTGLIIGERPARVSDQGTGTARRAADLQETDVLPADGKDSPEPAGQPDPPHSRAGAPRLYDIEDDSPTIVIDAADWSSDR